MRLRRVRHSHVTEVRLNLHWLVYSWNWFALPASPAVVKCCQLVFNFLPVHSQLDIRTANFLQKFCSKGNLSAQTVLRRNNTNNYFYRKRTKDEVAPLPPSTPPPSHPTPCTPLSHVIRRESIHTCTPYSDIALIFEEIWETLSKLYTSCIQ